MQLIPVIDLKGGHAVHARRGQREGYKPLRTPLAPSSDPVDVAAAFMALAPFRTLYIADLDAIAGRGSHEFHIAAVRDACGSGELWVDAGTPCNRQISGQPGGGPSVVVGTESFARMADLVRALGEPGLVLSLDHDAHGPLGPSEIHGRPDLWPPRVIVMTLAKVGAGEGPDYDALRRVRALRPDGAVFAAGGVRGPADLERLADMGVAGALVASALHDGRIDARTAAAYA